MEYTKCLVELNEVLKHLEKVYLEKIPQDIRIAIENQMDKDYNWTYDETKKLDEQNLDKKTIALLAYLNMEYLVNDEQRKLLEEYHKFNEQRQMQEEYSKSKEINIKTEKYEEYNNPTKIKSEQEDKNMALIEAVTPRWYEKIFLFVKKALKNKT